MRFLKAKAVFNGVIVLPAGAVLVLDQQGTLADITWDTSIDEGKIEKFDGTFTPGFVNSHCHLELSHLRNRIPQHTGLPDFGKKVISLRNSVAKEEIAEHMQDANNDMWQNGIVAVGDISNVEDSFAEKAGSKIFYHTFIELIGLNPSVSEPVFNQGLALLKKTGEFGLKGSLAAHAPYSTSRILIEKIVAYNSANGLSFSIHNQESEEETKFFMGEKNDFQSLYEFLSLDISWFKAPGCSPLKSYLDVLTDSPALLVHNRVTTREDLEAAHSKNIYWCFCPGANVYIENKLPDFRLFEGQKQKICLGTDSLSSNTSLNLINEASLILKASDTFSPEDLLRSMTSQGAQALGVDTHFGMLAPGRNSGLNLVSCEKREIKYLKKII